MSNSYTNFIFGESFSGFEIIGNKLIVLSFGLPFERTDFNTIDEYDKQVNNYLNEKPLIAKFYIYTINF